MDELSEVQLSQQSGGQLHALLGERPIKLPDEQSDELLDEQPDGLEWTFEGTDEWTGSEHFVGRRWRGGGRRRDASC